MTTVPFSSKSLLTVLVNEALSSFNLLTFIFVFFVSIIKSLIFFSFAVNFFLISMQFSFYPENGVQANDNCTVRYNTTITLYGMKKVKRIQNSHEVIKLV